MLSIIIGIGTVTATVSEFNVTPTEPVKGDVVHIEGSASPSEDVIVKITFGKTVSVESGEFVYRLYDVVIPSGPNRFTVTATNCEHLDVSVHKLIWITKGNDGSGGTATVSQSNVPAGTYDIRIKGQATDGASSSSLTIVAQSTLTADSSGKFSYEYDTSSVPPGVFTLDVGGVTKTLVLRQESEPSSNFIPAPEPQTEEEIIKNETSPETTSYTTSEDAGGESNNTDITESTQNNMSTDNTEMSGGAPGFEAILAIGALLSVLYLAGRRRN
ncbi:MAG: PGF-CTERM sorting domain-containing protein [Methermicoccaceae archaeon]